MSANDWLQMVGVCVALVICCVWIIRRLRRRNNSDCSCGCDGCSLRENCGNTRLHGK